MALIRKKHDLPTGEEKAIMKRTLIVLGAGASKDVYNPFPTGYELIKEINYHLTTDRICPPAPGQGPYLSDLMNKAVECFGNAIESSIPILKTQLWRIVLDYEWKYIRDMKTPAPSIDRFIYEKIQSGELNDDAKQVARFAIAYLIKGLEQALSENKTLSENDSWTDQLFQKLKNHPFQDVLQNLTVITFNYDRVFEYHVQRHIKRYFPKASPGESSMFVGSVNHVYGSLGTLEQIPFEAKNEGNDELNAARQRCNLMNYSGDPIQWPTGTDFERIYFLGFGYDEENLKRLNLGGFTNASRMGTGKPEVANQYGIKTPCFECSKFCKLHLEV